MKIITYFSRTLVKYIFNVSFFIFGKPALPVNLRKAINLYSGEGFFEDFALIRAWDAPFVEIEKIVPQSGRVLDLGCGDGLLANYLAIASPKRKIIGIDLNKERVEKASRGVKNTKFIYGDIREKKIEKMDAVLLIHVLHHLPSKQDQVTLLKNLKKNIKKNGKLIVVEIVEEPIFKYWLTAFVDKIVVPILFDSKLFDNNVNFRKTKEWEECFKENGYLCKSYKASKSKPFSHIIFECENI